MSPAAVAGGLPASPTGKAGVNIFGRRVSWDALLIAVGGIVAAVVLWKASKPTATGYAPSQSGSALVGSGASGFGVGQPPPGNVGLGSNPPPVIKPPVPKLGYDPCSGLPHCHVYGGQSPPVGPGPGVSHGAYPPPPPGGTLPVQPPSATGFRPTAPYAGRTYGLTGR